MIPGLHKSMLGRGGRALALSFFFFAPKGVGADEGMAFFEREIRPLLHEHCHECHAAGTSQKGGLVLDSRQGWELGGESGPALVPGNPGESLLIRAVRYQDPHLEMPPKSRLSSAQISALEKWVAMGAPDPREGSVKKTAQGLSVEEGRNFWSYRPPAATDPPGSSENEEWNGAIDRFLLARMTEAGLEPSPPAAPEAALRRLHFDLTGLPPHPEQITAFAADPSEEAWRREVERLLASRGFGERWGRHWLDLARFGESFTLRGLIMREAWRYRDYVIEAFNRDLPYDQFLREQIAGDLMDPSATDLAERQRRRIATGFLALGNHNLEEQDKRQLDFDIVDEQLDTLGKALLGQTLGCARCHDHKFDPVPTRDYHALAGILASTVSLSHSNVSKWLDLPLPLDPVEEARVRDAETRLARLEEDLKAAEKMREKSAPPAPRRSPKNKAEAIAAAELPGWVVDDVEAEKVGEWKHSTFTKSYIGEGYLHDDNQGKGLKTLSFAARVPKAGRYEVRLAWTAGSNRATAVPVMISSADGDFPMQVDLSVEPPIDGRFLSLGEYRFESNGANFILISNEGTSGYVAVDAVQFLSAEVFPGLPPGQETESAAADQAAERRHREAAAEVARIKREIGALKASGIARPNYLGVKESEKPGDLPVFARGIARNPVGEPVPRGFLTVTMPALGAPAALPRNQSGRLELADWVASPRNPLTARVFVNRAWHWMFGRGLVRTTDNFGTTGEAPSHPELLDWLALRFMENGWSVKWLVREIALSRAYRLSAPADESPWAQADPENRLFARAPRRRLEAEAMRDAMLAASGRLESLSGGPTIRPGAANDYDYVQDLLCRSVYLPALRNSPHEMLAVFNMADTGRTTGRRELGTVAPQALFLLNHPFVLEQSLAAARRLLAEASTDESRLEWAALRILGRQPLASEKALAASLLAGTPPGEAEAAWSAIVQGFFASLDFRYLE